MPQQNLQIRRFLGCFLTCFQPPSLGWLESPWPWPAGKISEVLSCCFFLIARVIVILLLLKYTRHYHQYSSYVCGSEYIHIYIYSIYTVYIHIYIYMYHGCSISWTVVSWLCLCCCMSIQVDCSLPGGDLPVQTWQRPDRQCKRGEDPPVLLGIKTLKKYVATIYIYTYILYMIRHIHCKFNIYHIHIIYDQNAQPYIF